MSSSNRFLNNVILNKELTRLLSHRVSVSVLYTQSWGLGSVEVDNKSTAIWNFPTLISPLSYASMWAGVCTMCSCAIGTWGYTIQAPSCIAQPDAPTHCVELNASLCLQSCRTPWRRFYRRWESRVSLCSSCRRPAASRASTLYWTRSPLPQMSRCPRTSEPTSTSGALPCTSTRQAPQVRPRNSSENIHWHGERLHWHHQSYTFIYIFIYI